MRIDKNIKIPIARAICVKRKKLHTPNTLPFSEMKIGNSIFIKCKSNSALYKKTLGLMWYWSKQLNLKFVTRHNGTGLRIWRIKYAHTKP